MTTLYEGAFAKLNLTLDVLGKREDGYHDLQSVMQGISIRDDVEIDIGTGKPWSLLCSVEGIPTDERNLAWKAAKVFFDTVKKDPDGLEIRILKRIPMEAGLGGGSADAAAVLRALNKHYGNPLSILALAELGAQVGSDVPFCVLCGTAMVEGRGERLRKLPDMPDCILVVCKPDFPVSTPELFGKIDRCKVRCRPDTDGMIRALEQGDLEGVARRMYNVFEDVLPERQRSRVRDIKNTLIQCGALGANMSGTGPTAFGLFEDETAAREAYAQLSEQYRETYLAETV